VTDGRAVVETIPAALAGERLDRVVAMVTGLSRAEAAALVDGGHVSVDGNAVTARAARLAEGAVVAVDVGERARTQGPQPDPTVAFTVVHEDADVLVVDKPAGLVVHAGAGNRTGTLVDGLLARYPDLAGVGEADRPGIVHRLDKDTSGLLAVARTPAAHAALSRQLRAREVARRYVALVWGRFDSTRGVVDAPIGRSVRTPTRMAVSTRGREARTGYEVRAAYTDPVEASLLECRLETGRTHQIRVHVAAIGHPVVGDARYGGARQSFAVPRFFLHAAHLGFRHPSSGEGVVFDSPLPPDLQEVLSRLR
jgi:23S rRNA pseudouridine1911/1915/1917 synthase